MSTCLFSGALNYEDPFGSATFAAKYGVCTHPQHPACVIELRLCLVAHVVGVEHGATRRRPHSLRETATTHHFRYQYPWKGIKGEEKETDVDPESTRCADLLLKNKTDNKE